MTRRSKAEKGRDRAGSLETLRSILVTPPAGEVRVSASVVYVSRSGMSRRVVVHVPVRNKRWDRRTGEDRWVSEVWDASWNVARAIGLPFKDGAIVVGGCGFSAAHHVLYELGSALFSDRKTGLEWVNAQSY